MYKNIQTKHIELLGVIQTLIGEYTQCTGTIVNRAPATLEEAMQSKENYYYWSRGKYNSLDSTEKMGIEGSALFIFLNKTGFRGMFRIGPNGFNIPYGNYKNPEIINEAHLYEIHALIQGVQFECADFTESLAKVGAASRRYLSFERRNVLTAVIQFASTREFDRILGLSLALSQSAQVLASDIP
jgi:DNA adenine methylase